VLGQQITRRDDRVGCHPICGNCGQPMRIVRRGARHDGRGYYELQTFTCGSCNNRIERNVNTDGTPH
jgi:hypothetical protein